MQPKISIVVPVYKTEAYIHDCIDSILAQTFTDFELILVNDGSPDCSGVICDKYAAEDSRIRVFHKKNGGVSSARNMGLDKATGTWITFIDSDDCVEPAFLEGLYKPIADGEDVDFVHGGCLNMIDGKVVSINQSYDYHIGDETDILYLKLRGLTISKLFKADILEKIGLRFDEKMKIAEDMAFTLDYALHIKHFAFVPEKGYRYRKDNMASATNTDQPQKYDTALHSFFHLHESIVSYINKYQLKHEVAKLRLGYEAVHLQNVCIALYHNKYARKDRLNHLRNDFKDEYLELLRLAKQDKVKAIIFSFLERKRYILFDFFMKIYIDLKELKRNLS